MLQKLIFLKPSYFLIKYFLVFLISFCVSLTIIIISYKFPDFLDKNLKGAQKYHTHPVPRLGGIGIYLGVIFGTFYLKIFNLLNFSALPAFISGVFSDINKELSPKIRLFLISLSAILGIFLTNLYVSNLDFIALPKIVGIIITFIGILGFTNAINIIDGFNGLASGFSLVALTNFLLTVYTYKNFFLLDVITSLIFVILGFFILNFPFGFIFLGDGGAYYLGYIFSFLCILIKNLIPSVSAFYPFLVLLYPIYEVIFSIKRKLKRGTSPFKPDSYHFHMLVYKAIKKFLRRKYTSNLNKKNILEFLKHYTEIQEKIKFLANPLTTIFILFWISPFQGLAYIFKENSIALLILSILFIIYYNLTYKLLVMYLKNEI